jgi:hypothetical protein
MPDQSVMFQSIADFIDELKELGTDGMAENLVRVQIEEEEINCAITKYWLRAGYMTSEGDLHQLLICCGLSPVKVNSGMQPGDEVANEDMAALTEQLELHGLKVRRGMYVS